MKISDLKPEYDTALADLIRINLKKHHLDIPGTVYFDDNLNHLSDYYLEDPAERHYYVVIDDSGKLVGGIGLARFEFSKAAVNFRNYILQMKLKEQVLATS